MQQFAPSDRRDRAVLYSFRRCPFAMRARLAIAAGGVSVELREVLLRDKPAHMVALSSKATVPVLWLSDGRVIDESLDVMNWALAQDDRDRLRRETTHEDLITLIDTRFKFHLDRYKYASRFAAGAKNEHRAAGLEILTGIDARLSANGEGDWLGGAYPGFADLAILPFVRQYRIADNAWFDARNGLENVQAWLARFLDWPGFHAVMQKYPQWREGAPVVIFPSELDN